MPDQSTPRQRPKLAVYKFSSCDGCQLQLLELEDELLELAGEIDIAYFLEARRQVTPGPYDIGLVEGSISTPDEEERIRKGQVEIAGCLDTKLGDAPLPEAGSAGSPAGVAAVSNRFRTGQR